MQLNKEMKWNMDNHDNNTIYLDIDNLFGGQIKVTELNEDELENYSKSYSDFIADKSSSNEKEK